MKHRAEIEQKIVEIISDNWNYNVEYYEAIYTREQKVAAVLEDMDDNDLITLLESYGSTLDEIVTDIIFESMHKLTTCVITHADQMRLSSVNQKKTLTENFTTVLDTYHLAQMSPASIDEMNPSESGDSEHVLTLALEVLNDRIPEKDEWS